MAENLLPFFVIQGLYNLAFKPGTDGSNVSQFADIACEFYHVKGSRIPEEPQDVDGSLYLLDMLRKYVYLPTDLENAVSVGIKDAGKRKISFPSATRLRKAGIKFQLPLEGQSKKLPDIKFDERKGILTIPRILINDWAEPLLRSLTAFEQRHHVDARYMAGYLFFMNCLINKPEDVELLVKAGIVENRLGSEEEVANLFKDLGKRVSIIASQYYYESIGVQLNAHCGKSWNTYIATLMRKHFGDPWKISSLVCATAILILTIIIAAKGG